MAEESSQQVSRPTPQAVRRRIGAILARYGDSPITIKFAVWGLLFMSIGVVIDFSPWLPDTPWSAIFAIWGIGLFLIGVLGFFGFKFWRRKDIKQVE